MKNSSIEWCDHTFNPWEGCEKVSPGCAHCYAEARNARFGGGTAPNWGFRAPRRRTSAANWQQPRVWDMEAEVDALQFREYGRTFHNDGLVKSTTWRRPRVFCASLGDWLDFAVPAQWRIDLLDLIERTPHLDWLLLTKRPESFSARMTECLHGSRLARTWLNGEAPANVWLGTSVEDQARLDERVPHLYEIPARVRFLSMEPLLSEVDLFDALLEPVVPLVDWVIVGGESGPDARPMHPDWARVVRDQCTVAGVPFFFKQWGEWAPADGALTGDDRIVSRVAGSPCLATDSLMVRAGKKRAGHLLDGLAHRNFPVIAIQPEVTP